MKRLLACACIGAISCAPAGARELTPDLMMLYAQLGAITYAREATAQGNYRGACTALRDLLQMERQSGEPQADIQRTVGLMTYACSR